MGFDTAIQAVALAWITRRLPPEVHTLRFPYYPHRSIKELSWAIRRPVRGFGQSEVLASGLLAWLSYSGCNETDAHLHFARSLGMLLYLLELQDPSSRRGKGPTGDLTTYGPFIIDCANAWATRNGGTPTRSTTFAQRVDYFDNLFQVTSTENIWYSGILEAANVRKSNGNLPTSSLRSSPPRSTGQEHQIRSWSDWALYPSWTRGPRSPSWPSSYFPHFPRPRYRSHHRRRSIDHANFSSSSLCSPLSFYPRVSCCSISEWWLKKHNISAKSSFHFAKNKPFDGTVQLKIIIWCRGIISRIFYLEDWLLRLMTIQNVNTSLWNDLTYV